MGSAGAEFIFIRTAKQKRYTNLIFDSSCRFIALIVFVSGIHFACTGINLEKGIYISSDYHTLYRWILQNDPFFSNVIRASGQSHKIFPQLTTQDTGGVILWRPI